MICRILLISLIGCLMVWPYETIDTVANVSVYGYEWLSVLNSEYEAWLESTHR